MKKTLLGFCLAAFLLQASDLYGQLDRGTIRRNNKRLMTYRGMKSTFSQEKRYTAVGFGLHALNYYGDLAPNAGQLSTDLSFTRPALGVSAYRRLGPRYGLMASFLYGTLRGEDESSADYSDVENARYRYYRNLSFRNRIKELSVVAVFDLFENMGSHLNRVPWTPYVFGGLAVFHHNPQALAPAQGLDGSELPEAGQWVNLRDLGTEGQYADLLPDDANYGIKPYNLLQVAIPFGVGVRFKVNDALDFSAELALRYLFTDYIDDVSRNYVDLGVFDSELARALSYRSNELTVDVPRRPVTARNGVTYDLINGYGAEHPTNMRGGADDKDIYTVTTFRLSYILGKYMYRPKYR